MLASYSLPPLVLGCPSTSKLEVFEEPERGTIVTAAACSTPGRPWMFCITCCWKANCLGPLGYFFSGNTTEPVSRLVVSKPRSVCNTRFKLLSMRPAPARSITAKAISETTRMFRKLRPDPTDPRPASCNSRCRLGLNVCMTGASPNRMPVVKESPRANQSTALFTVKPCNCGVASRMLRGNKVTIAGTAQ